MAVKGKPEPAYSSSDEAPEEELVSIAAVRSKKQAQDRLNRRIEDKKVTKQKRKVLDGRLKAQKKKLLSELLNDLQGSEDEDEEVESVEVVAPVVRPVSQSRRKNLEVEKDGIAVKVLEKRNRKLPPPSSNLLSRREKFLFRKSIPRR